MIQQGNNTNVKTSETKAKVYKVKKPLKNNSYLTMILNDRNDAWKRELYMCIKKENAIATHDHVYLIITSSNSQSRTERDWSKHINSVISEYFKEFELKTIKSDEAAFKEVNSIIQKIEDIRKLYLIDYIREDKTLYFMGRKDHMADFLNRNQLLQSLKSSDNSFETIKSSIVNIPVLKNESRIFSKSSLISMALSKLDRICDLKDHFMDNIENQIELNGLRSNVERATKLLEANLPNIKCKRVNLIELALLNSTNLQNFTAFKNSLTQIIGELLSDSRAIYKLTIKQNTDETEAYTGPANMVEIYLTFFYNFAEINSIDDNVYEEISRLLIENLSTCVLDVTKSSNFILTKAWKDFEIENLSSKAIGKHVYYALSNVNSRMRILLVGLKNYLEPLIVRIENFLKSNEFKTAKISLNQDDVNATYI